MKKIFALILFGATMLSAQTNRFIYEYKYIPNIKEKDTVRKDLMALDITDKGSVYQSMSKMERDSIMNVKMELIMKNILMIATGGTIASKEGDLGLTPAVTGEELAASVPGIKDICHLEILQLMNIDSTNMRPRQWLMTDTRPESAMTAGIRSSASPPETSLMIDAPASAADRAVSALIVSTLTRTPAPASAATTGATRCCSAAPYRPWSTS